MQVVGQVWDALCVYSNIFIKGHAPVKVHKVSFHVSGCHVGEAGGAADLPHARRPHVRPVVLDDLPELLEPESVAGAPHRREFFKWSGSVADRSSQARLREFSSNEESPKARKFKSKAIVSISHLELTDVLSC